MSNAHAKFSPSSAERIATCPASLKHNDNRERTASAFSAEGTCAHDLAEKYLNRFVPDFKAEFLGTTQLHDGYQIEVDQDMIDHIHAYAVYCRTGMTQFDVEWVETRVDISHITPIPDQFGTCDHAWLDIQNRTLYITDLKYGKGVEVYAKRNAQLALYAAGFFEQEAWLYKIDKIVIRVYQPRRNHTDEWEVTVAELLAFVDELRQAFKVAMLDDAPYKPDEKACRFCAHNATCKALGDHVLALTNDAFGMDDDINECVDFYHQIPLIKIKIEAVEKHLYELALNGAEIPTLKLVEGRSVRVWSSDEAAAAAMEEVGIPEDDRYNKKLIGIGDAEKKAGKQKALLAKAMTKPAGSPTLVNEDDPRPALSMLKRDGSMFE